MTATLVTVAFSHFCEKARWALDHAGIAHVEDRHLPMFHWLATFRAGGGRTVPVLVTADGVFADSTAILRWVDRVAPPARKLLPEDPELRSECDALEDEYDEQLGPAVRRIGYWHAFTEPGLMLEIARDVAPSWQVEMMRTALPAVRIVMMRAMDIDEETVARSHDEVRRVLDRVAARLSDGRPYLAGGRFTAADLTFAALAAPLVAPPEHPVPLPDDRPALQAIRREHRAHPAGAFALRMYALHRSLGAPPRGANAAANAPAGAS